MELCCTVCMSHQCCGGHHTKSASVKACVTVCVRSSKLRGFLNVHQQWLGLTFRGLTLSGGQLVHHEERGVQAAHKRHQA